MFEPETEYLSEQTGDILISACQGVDPEDTTGASCLFCLRIENNSAEKIQILGKTLNITDDKGNNVSQSGLGFNGEMPELYPGEYFEFEDTAFVRSALAVLYGTCRILTESTNQVQDIKIPVLNLFSPQKHASALN